MITKRAEETGVGRTGTTRRRALLATGAAAAAMVTGCSDDAAQERPPRGPAADPAQAEKALRRRLAARSRTLLDEYDAVIARHPALAGRLTPLRAHVAAHVAALAGRKQAPAAPVSPSPSGTGSVVPGGPAPDDPVAALKALAAAERRTSDAHTASLADAEPELARLLASVAAAGAAHAYLLTKGDAR
ncbi:hypothetical protein AB0K02_18825 [Streptomyces sp. NPDC049597]|uniref:hypothetical protein n=1 Tax=Streptomyces sp. NPDC049597 TaxID=3155276 RepID=UPI0034380703